MSPGAITWWGLSLPKDGLSPDECEDALAADPAAGRFAIADGATEGCFSGEWARLLVGGFLRAQDDDLTVGGWIGPARERWSRAVDPLVVPWYLDVKREAGAFAAFLGVTVRPAREARPPAWQAVAVGDCCLIHLSGDRVVRSFPIDVAAGFDNRPDLIPSRFTPDAPLLTTAAGEYAPGDWLFMATDALAAWALGRREADRPVWDMLRSCGTAPDPAASLAANVSAWRKDGMRNDDVTLLAVYP